MLDETQTAMDSHKAIIDMINARIVELRAEMTPHQEAINQCLAFLGEHEHVSEERIEELRKLSYTQ